MDKGYNTHGPSEKCEMIRKDECTFEACNEKYNGLRKCVGGKLALYVYKVYEKRKRIYVFMYLLTAKNVFEKLSSVVTSTD